VAALFQYVLSVKSKFHRCLYEAFFAHQLPLLEENNDACTAIQIGHFLHVITQNFVMYQRNRIPWF